MPNVIMPNIIMQNVIMPNVIMPNVIMPNVIMPNVVLPYHYANSHYAKCHDAKCHYAKCHYAKCHYAECNYAKYQFHACYFAKCNYAKLHFADCSCAKYNYAKCIYAKCIYAKCHHAKCHHAKCHHAKCHHLKCHHAKCRGAIVATQFHRWVDNYVPGIETDDENKFSWDCSKQQKNYFANKLERLANASKLTTPFWERLDRGILKGKYHCTIDLLFDWFGLVCFENRKKNCLLSSSWFQNNQTGGQWYSNTSPFSIPWLDFRPTNKLTSVKTI